jgi:hypothetical protein
VGREKIWRHLDFSYWLFQLAFGEGFIELRVVAHHQDHHYFCRLNIFLANAEKTCGLIEESQALII